MPIKYSVGGVCSGCRCRTSAVQQPTAPSWVDEFDAKLCVRRLTSANNSFRSLRNSFRATFAHGDKRWKVLHPGGFEGKPRSENRSLNKPRWPNVSLTKHITIMNDWWTFINLFIFQSRLPILWQYSTSLRRFTNKIIIEAKYFSLDGDCSVFCIFRKTFLRKSPPLFIHLLFTDGSLWSVEG